MEALQGLTTLRAPGYSQAVIDEIWLTESPLWLSERVEAHQAIRDAIFAIVDSHPAMTGRVTEGGSYLFLHSPVINGRLGAFVGRLRTDEGIVVTRGDVFGDFPDAVRLNFSQRPDSACEGLHRIGRALDGF